MKLFKLLQLMRVDKPIGTVLLWCPTAWALWLANHQHPAMKLVGLFLLGTFLMRSAGCVVNDMIDRNIDLHVKRTKNRPLTSGAITLTDAWIILFTLLLLAVMILFFLPLACLQYAIAAVMITLIYPFCKRFFNAPQLILSIAFSMGIPMAYVASNAQPNTCMMLLYAINLLWVIAYDTVYAMNDEVDDRQLGIHSTAILFGRHAKIIITSLTFCAHIMWLAVAALAALPPFFYLAWLAGLLVIGLQTQLLVQNKANFMPIFYLHGAYGVLMWLSLFQA